MDEALLRKMTGILSHRGPDGEGLLCRGPVGFGHRRLAIIDLVTGDQPMTNEDGSLWLVFNGEIYNFRELRRELEAQGHTFRTSSDTEVILRAYEAYGEGCVGRLRGMFAFAIWDERCRKLLLARDRVGIKPLVYAWDGRQLRFASELKAILQDPSVERQLDWEALRDYLVFHYIASPRTIFKTIRKLPPASYLVFRMDGGEPEVRQYWDLRFVPDRRRSEADWMEGLRWHLQDAVRSHLVSDVPIGAFLSGGMDSSSVVALMAQAEGRPVRTFSIGFDEADFDEVRYARNVARRYGTEHYEFVVKPDALEALPRLAWQFDEPFADSSAIPTYYVSKITREHVTVALSGDGGDENFAGYRRYAQALAFHDRMDRLPGLLARPLFRFAGKIIPCGIRGQGYLELLGSDQMERYFRLVAFQRSFTLRRLLTPETQTRIDPEIASADFPWFEEGRATADYISAMQYVDIKSYLPGDILTKVDRTSMLVSLEARVPLLDHVLMEYVASMPPKLKLHNGSSKAILKLTMGKDLPPAILGRQKMGFGVPLEEWFRGELAEHTREVLLDPGTRDRRLFDPVAINTLLAEHQSGRRNRSSQIWALLCFEGWARQWWDK